MRDGRIARIAAEAEDGFERAGRGEIGGEDVGTEIDRHDEFRRAFGRTLRRFGMRRQYKPRQERNADGEPSHRAASREKSGP